MALTSYIKPACLSSDVYKGIPTINRSYGVLKPRLITLKDDCVGMAIHNDNKFYISFRGCKSLDEVMYCVETGMKKPFLNKPMKINKAIWDKYEELKDDIDDILSQEKNTNNIVFTGHSLGGAIAQIATLIHDQSATCITLGAPYVGDVEYKKECDLVIEDNVRIVVKQDIIPKIRFNNELVHTGEEIILPSISKSLFPYSIYDHHSSINYLRCLREGVVCDPA